ncbi:uncharacterized protein LOC125608690 [Brassica napus]|uniref:uncharacterized protein LOC125597291 n=1 Tax=Brassica napus TaxID=3708 RepID=UPI002078F94B|nr:uncharacterized protein LOC125597291 [Brassica napus]XP_048635094.1 uncharacterized protein LOC125608690 [Brassica napus]
MRTYVSYKWIDDPIEGLRAPWRKNYYFNVNLSADALIDHASRRWNYGALNDNFVPGDVEIINRNQPVVSREDFFVWKYNKSGLISVKSAYWLASSLKTSNRLRDVICLPSINPIKEKVWALHTSPKLKVFLWKMLSEALPVAELIKARGLKVDDLCQICGFVEESINHLMFDCTYARQIWALSGIPNPENGFHQSSIYVNFNYLLELKKLRWGFTDLRSLWPWIMWTIWKTRNALLFEGTRFSPLEVFNKAKQDEEEWSLAQVVDKDFQQAGIEIRVKNKKKWVSPPGEWLMCNFAFDWCKVRSLMGAAWVLRNGRGVVVCHGRRAFSAITSKDQAKLQVVLWTVESMRSMRFDKVVFAGEMEDLFGAVNRPQAWPSFLFQVGEIESEARGIEDVRWQVITKDQNGGATFIAQSVTNQNRMQSYVARSHPIWLSGFFASERCGL